MEEETAREAYAIAMLMEHKGLSEEAARDYLRKHHATCTNGRECPWMPPLEGIHKQK